jgi:hypothetical protein
MTMFRHHEMDLGTECQVRLHDMVLQQDLLINIFHKYKSKKF